MEITERQFGDGEGNTDRSGLRSRGKRRHIRIASEALVFLILLAGIVLLVRREEYCSYESCVHRLASSDLREADAGAHRFALETVWTDEEDYVRLTRIAGWEADLAQGEYSPGACGILLRSEEASYRLDIFREERSELSIVKKSKPEGAETELGFFTYFPQSSVETGEYEIGLLVREDGEERVLWTGRSVAVP